MILVAVAFLLSLATGWCLVACLWPAGAPRRYLAFRVCLGAGLGLWVSSCGTFAAIALRSASLPVLLGIDVGLLAIACGLRRRLRGPGERALMDAALPAPSPKLLGSSLVFLAALSASAALAYMAWNHLELPFGHWDAWAIWNLKAKFLHAGGDRWTGLFSEVISFSHPDYPLLLPLNVARLWTYARSEAPLMPAVLSILLAFLSLATLVSFVTLQRGRVLGALSGLTVLAVPRFLEHASYQLADIHAGSYLLAALCTLTLALSREDSAPRLFVLAGFLAGAAAWTKSEGGLMAFGVLMGLGALAVHGRTLRRARRSLPGFALGCVVALSPWLVLKTTLSTHSTHFEGATLAAVLERLVDPARHWMVLSFFARDARSLFGIPLLIGLAALALLSGLRPAGRSALTLCAVTLGIVLGGYYLVFVITSMELELLLVNTISRLSLQLLPGFLLLYYLAIREPAALVSATKTPGGRPEPV